MVRGRNDLLAELNAPTVATSYREWIDAVADSEGVSREEVLAQLVSAHWTVSETSADVGRSKTAGESELDPRDVEILYPEEESEDVHETTGPSEVVHEIGERLDRLEATVAESEFEVESAEYHAEVIALTQRIEVVASTLTKRFDGLERRVDDEFENLVRILTYLLEETDSLADRFDPVSEDLKARRRWVADQARLLDLKRRACQRDVRRASCEHCGVSIDIALLPTPDCPHCDRPFADVERTKRRFRRPLHTLKVAGASVTDELGPEVGAPRRPSGSPPRPDVVGGFLWGEDRN